MASNKNRAKTGFTAWALVVFVFLYLPIAVMVLFAFNQPAPEAIANNPGVDPCSIPATQIGNVSVWNGFTTCWFPTALHDPTYIPAIITSAEIAFVAAAVSVVLGLMAALALARMKPRGRIPFDILVYLTLVVPEIVIAVASLIFFVQAHNSVPFWRVLKPLETWASTCGPMVVSVIHAMWPWLLLLVPQA